MEAWQNFFLGELGASAAFAGLIFVSLSVNQTRILETPGLPERALQTLLTLLLVLIASSLTLVPAQPPQILGIEILVVAGGQIVVVTLLQRSGISRIPEEFRASWMRLAIFAQIASWCFIVAALMLITRADWVGAYLLVPGTLLSFIVAGINAWVLLIEINR